MKFEGIKKEKNEISEDSFQYEYFNDINERHDIFEFCKELAVYLYDENIKNIFFLDRSARPAWIGVDEYWNQNFSETPKPGFYFINPDGLIASTTSGLITNPREIENLILELSKTGKLSPPRFENDIIERFSSLYTELMKDKEESIVVFDTCAHSGKTMRPVLDLLHKVGFSDVRVVTANEPDAYSGLEPDAVIDTFIRIGSCNPFGTNSLVQKGNDIVSNRNNDSEDQEEGNLVRREIREIMRNHGE